LGWWKRPQFLCERLRKAKCSSGTVIQARNEGRATVSSATLSDHGSRTLRANVVRFPERNKVSVKVSAAPKKT
jgi:hypothetical protein